MEIRSYLHNGISYTGKMASLYWIKALVPSHQVNSSPPSAAYMHQWTKSALVQVMACRLLSHYLNQCWLIVNWTLGKKFMWNTYRNFITFIQENASEIVVCQNGGHFARGRWVNLLQLNWRLPTQRWNSQVPGLQMSCSDWMKMIYW